MINNMIATGKARGMIAMDQSLTELVKTGVVEPDEALDRAIDKESFKTMIGALPKRGQVSFFRFSPGSQVLKPKKRDLTPSAASG